MTPTTIKLPPTSKPPTKPSAPLKLPVSKPNSAPARTTAHSVKTFAIHTWTDANEGEKILEYAKTGTGKTTLAAMAPNAVFIGLDDGGRKIVNPLTGEPIQAIPGIVGFDDLRDALHQKGLIPAGSTIVVDTITKLEAVMEPYIFSNYPASQGKKAANMRAYGWDGPAHVLDCFRLFLSDLEEHVRNGTNVVLLAQLGQVSVANAGGVDYLEDGPKLQHNKQYSVRTEICEWCDHVLRIGYQNFEVVKDNDKAKVGKVVEGDGTRAVFTDGCSHFLAKSRPIDGKRLPPVVSFSSPADNSLWQMIFEGAIPTETA